jgi:hypothetical protein
MSKPKERQDPIAALEEWHDHQYDPGHYIGGRLPPYLLGKRPNLYGCILLASGLSLAGLVLFGAIMRIAQGASPVPDSIPLLASVPASIVGVGIIAVQILAGIKLLRKPSKKRESR